ncbi:peptidoglycan-binding protein [Streptomyces sp. TLI_146]|uniref:peptidoglycan-binding domain-containing protein n=1 Tax=Streptomyces sp. TLI_146 TaxID=1938858 RepID=UPI000C706C0D|nr:peptidoglycan-binding domain-containing protein [Streptomyces sp. TLI_146]PKV83049.1 putative peptidoglycan binding protein [Streptomyces sp. TLI_146]
MLTGPNCERTPGAPLLKRGDTGRAVRELQCLLAYCGYYTGPLDGYYGSALGQALLRYQRDHGLPMDGEAGPRVWALLRAGVC